LMGRGARGPSAADEVQPLEEIKKAVTWEALTPTEKVWADDACLLRYLRARKLQVSKAHAMFEASIKWRREFGVEALLASSLEDVQHESTTGKMYTAGKDKEGRPIVLMKPRYQNSTNYTAQMRHLVYTLERAISRMDGDVGKILLLIDFKGLSRQNISPMSVFRETLTILQDHYPERLGMSVLIDAPSLFLGVYRLLKPFLDATTKEKIVWTTRPFKEGSAGTQILSGVVDNSELEADYGGSSGFVYQNESYFSGDWKPKYFSQ